MYVGVLHVSSCTGWTCHMTECTEPYHALRECSFFRSLSAGERTRRVRRLRLCEGCLTFGHSTRVSCPFRKGDDGLCPVRKCGRGLHRLLHDEGIGGSTDSQDAEQGEEASCNSGISVRNPVQLMTQWVKDGGGESCLAFWDLGSQVSLVTTQYAQERKLVQMGSSSLKLSGLGSGPALRATYRYKVTLMRTDGQIVELIAHGLETIASNLDAIDPRVLRQAFLGSWKGRPVELAYSSGRIICAYSRWKSEGQEAWPCLYPSLARDGWCPEMRAELRRH